MTERERESIRSVLFLFHAQVVYMALVGSFPFNAFLSGFLSSVGTAVLAGEMAERFL